MGTFFILFISFLWTVQGDQLQFPDDFKFGVATAAYQVEGAWNENGKGESIWDRLVHQHPDWIADGTTGDIACDSYHKIKEDVQQLKWLGVHFYRFSLSWSRILPAGYVNWINEDGVRYYNELIDALLAEGIQPFVTIYHWDLPQRLQDIGGWPNPLIADAFEDYARLAFRLFGDRVKMWSTFNEPIVVCNGGYADGFFAPAISSDGIGNYMCGKTLLVAHGRAYRVYQNEFKEQQQGKVGIALNAFWYEPASDSAEDLEAQERGMQMQLGWWAHPIFSKTGDYPPVMKDRISKLSWEEGFPRSRLPSFTAEEIELIRGSYDFFGLNHYSTSMASADTKGWSWTIPSYSRDVELNLYVESSWPESTAAWLRSVPWGFRRLLNWIKNEYDNPPVWITENGWGDNGEWKDVGRVNYYRDYLNELLYAIHYDSCNVHGYTAWSLMDNFEWRVGFSQRFGLYNTDITVPERTRTAKDSAYYFKKIIENKAVVEPYK